MVLLILGLALWSAAHLFKRLAPARRAALGDRGKGVVALGSVLGGVAMIIGYRMADVDLLWSLGSWARHANNGLMVIAVLLFLASSSQNAIKVRMRHPQLTGTIVWTVAHLLVNGDVASLVLFGGLGLWAVAEIALINRGQPDWQRPDAPATTRGNLALVGQSIVFFAVAWAVHAWLGYQIFGG